MEMLGRCMMVEDVEKERDNWGGYIPWDALDESSSEK